MEKLLEKELSTADAILYKKNGKYPNVFVRSDEDILKKITGLQASSGAVVVSRRKSALFVDSRYALAAKQYVNPGEFEILDLKNKEIVAWIGKNLPSNSKIACDFQYYSYEEMDFFTDRLKNCCLVPIDLKKTLNIPPSPLTLDIYRCESNEDKISCVMDAIYRNNLDAYLIYDPCAIAWLLNIRDLNQKYTPVVLGSLLVTKDRRQFLYLDEDYGAVDGFRTEADLANDITQFARVGIDKSQTPFSIKHRNFIDISNPCIALQVVKNQTEIDDMRLAARKDSVAIVDFLHWFHTSTEEITELNAAEKLLHFRKQQEGFVSESFETIAAADGNAAMVHYSPTAKTNKTVRNILLIDSGGQYKRGTTDITRTVSINEPSAEQKLFYTLVLKGHIALADVKFPPGTTGAQLDPLARQFLWQYAGDYGHSTGHGIGHMSHVHEGQVMISKNNDIPLQPGMILSNEPGYYLENGFGIRLENMILTTRDADSGFLFFETISLVPFDHKFICKDLLTEREINWLKKYNRRILSTLETRHLDWLSDHLKEFL
jgi:Xaa-Pro aminopeptidase